MLLKVSKVNSLYQLATELFHQINEFCFNCLSWILIGRNLNSLLHLWSSTATSSPLPPKSSIGDWEKFVLTQLYLEVASSRQGILVPCSNFIAPYLLSKIHLLLLKSSHTRSKKPIWSWIQLKYGRSHTAENRTIFSGSIGFRRIPDDMKFRSHHFCWLCPTSIKV